MQFKAKILWVHLKQVILVQETTNIIIRTVFTPYDLCCVGGDVKYYSTNHAIAAAYVYVKPLSRVLVDRGRRRPHGAERRQVVYFCFHDFPGDKNVFGYKWQRSTLIHAQKRRQDTS